MQEDLRSAFNRLLTVNPGLTVLRDWQPGPRERGLWEIGQVKGYVRTYGIIDCAAKHFPGLFAKYLKRKRLKESV